MVNDARVSARCITLVENLLREEYKTLRRLQDLEKTTYLSEYKIARYEYALGERETPPILKEYMEREI